MTKELPKSKYTFYEKFSKVQVKIEQKKTTWQDKKTKQWKTMASDYCTWSDAWEQVLKIYPDATYEIITHGEQNLPYQKCDNLGYLVWTKVRIEGKEMKMWLPVMGGGHKTILDPTVTDINKSIMRCLVKNIAVFGLGLHLYKGEDLPEGIKEEQKKIAEENGKPITKEQLEEITELYNQVNQIIKVELFNQYLKSNINKTIEQISNFTFKDYNFVKAAINKKIQKIIK